VGTREAQMLVACRRCDNHDLHPHSSLGTRLHRSSREAGPRSPARTAGRPDTPVASGAGGCCIAVIGNWSKRHC